MRACLPVLATVGALALPAIASAGTISVDPDAGSLQFAAAPGEVNDVQVLQTGDGFLRDLGAPLIAGAGCTLLADAAGDCGFVGSYGVSLGDRGDHADITVPGALSILAGPGADSVKAFSSNGSTVNGGPGDDTIENNADIPSLDGDGGDDRLTALGRGGATIVGGAGDDVIAALEAAWTVPGANTIDAGPGDDRVTALATSRPSTVAGGAGNDRIAILPVPGVSPDEYAHPFGGGPATVAIDGGPGHDSIAGGPTADAVNAGPGWDVVDVAGGGADSVSCGPGIDAVRFDSSDVVGRDCELRFRAR